MKSLLVDPIAHPVVLFGALTKRYGNGWMEWAPFTLRETIRRDFGVEIDVKNLARVLAAAGVLRNDRFFTNWETFHFLAPALNGIPPMPSQMQEHSVAQMMAAVDDAMFLRQMAQSLTPVPGFSDEVSRYVASHALNDGVWFLPDPLAFASSHAAGKRYLCKDCGNEGECLFDDNHCDVCLHRFDMETLGSHRADPDAQHRGLGQNTTIFYQRPAQPVAIRLAELRGQKDPQFRPNQVDTCCRRLLSAEDYVQARRTQRDTGLRDFR